MQIESDFMWQKIWERFPFQNHKYSALTKNLDYDTYQIAMV